MEHADDSIPYTPYKPGNSTQSSVLHLACGMLHLANSPKHPAGVKPPAGGAEVHMAPTMQTSNRREVISITDGIGQRCPSAPRFSFLSITAKPSTSDPWLVFLTWTRLRHVLCRVVNRK